MIPSIGRARETANRVKCASNMRQIGQAILLYSNDNRAAYPETLDQLLATQDITSDVFICPTSNDTAAMPNGSKPQQVVALHAPGHLSYVYVGKGLTNQSSADAIVLYENPTNHDPKDGMNFLWADGHVSWESAPVATYYISEVTTGHNPPRPRSGQ
jgi:prepilin-type processing-associated H-X9-DG protein